MRPSVNQLRNSTIDSNISHEHGVSRSIVDILPWLSVLGAWLCFGSFAVPMKWSSVVEAQVHPLVFQCYKTTWTFLTSYLVLLFEPYEFSYWGIVSGFSWVPAGVAAVIAVQNVGIACGQAIWQVTIIATSMVWGFLVLQDEDVYNWWGTGFSILGLILGVVGMTLSFNLRPKVEDGDASEASVRAITNSQVANADARSPDLLEPGSPIRHSRTAPQLLVQNEEEHPPRETQSMPTFPGHSYLMRSSLSLGRSLSRRTLSDIRYNTDDVQETGERRASIVLGISAALFNGVWGGSNLVPSQYAPIKGVHFVISFGNGALIANAVLLVSYGLLVKLWWRTPLPRPHFKVMAIPGFLSGTLWSAGNFCSLYAVNTLGQGIGYSLIQSSVIVSGMWGLLYYRELSGKPILIWMFFCIICIAGALGLAVEKKHA